MPEIIPQDTSLKHLTGRHLWHAPLSSCSQRVRLVLAELGLAYESHVLDLEAGEHATESYQAIHPDGVVPAYLDEGRLFIESIDIIQHVSKGAFGTPSGIEKTLLQNADAAQRDLKLLTFEFLFRAKPAASNDAVDSFQRNHKNAWLRQFYRDFSVGFDRQRLAGAIARTQQGFQVLNATLEGGQSYLSGDGFGLADIAWLPNVHRMDLMGWPFESLSKLDAWFEIAKQRSSYQDALLNWQADPVAHAFRDYTRTRDETGTGVRSFLCPVPEEDQTAARTT